MKEQIKRTIMLNTRLRRADLALLEALCNRRGCNHSEAVRQAITNEAAKEGLYSISGSVVSRENGTQNSL